MKRVLKVIEEGKKSRLLGEPQVVSKDEFEELELDAKVEMIQALIPSGLMHVSELLAEVERLAGRRSQYGPSWKEPVERQVDGATPTAMDSAPEETADERGKAAEFVGELKGAGEVDEILLNRVLYGISCRINGVFKRVEGAGTADRGRDFSSARWKQGIAVGLEESVQRSGIDPTLPVVQARKRGELFAQERARRNTPPIAKGAS